VESEASRVKKLKKEPKTKKVRETCMGKEEAKKSKM